MPEYLLFILILVVVMLVNGPYNTRGNFDRYSKWDRHQINSIIKPYPSAV